MRRMNIRQLESFLAIARHGGFVEAAERLNVTQSTISARIKELEQDLGVALFDRSRRQVQLTPKGRELLDYASRAVALQREIKQRIGLPEAISGVFRIGVAELIAVTWLPHFAASVRHRYPAVTLQFDVTMNPAMLEGLRSGSLDLALMIHTGSATDLLARPLGVVPFAWMAAADFPLPDRTLGLEELRRLPIIYQSADSFMNQFMSAMLYPEGNSRRSGTSCNSLAARVSLIMAGLGVSLMPLMTLETARHPGSLRVVPTEPARVDVSYDAVCARAALSPALLTLMEMAVEASSFTRPLA
jgi:DNA-binding transcriptional LysR family regulator